MAKGSSYEREICNKLSSWWVPGRTDIFWRSAGSGARAKVRGRKGHNTVGQHGDICATDPCGDHLTRALTIEIKRGYSSSTIADVLDRSRGAAQQQIECFLQQTMESAAQAKSISWLLIVRRDRRDAIVFMPIKLMQKLELTSRPSAIIKFTMEKRHLVEKKKVIKKIKGKDVKRNSKTFRSEQCKVTLGVMNFDKFLESVTPSDIRRLLKTGL